MGVDAVEPDVVVSSDGVLVIRHENEISQTTDIADRPEFAHRRTTKVVDGTELTGWFTEDFTWAELATLRCRERIPKLRPESATHNDSEPILRLRDLLDLVSQANTASKAHAQANASRAIGVVLEIKHATYFDHLGWDVSALVAQELHDAGWAQGEHPLVIESFESTVLRRLQERDVTASYVYLLEAEGKPFDLSITLGADAPEYAEVITPAGLDRLIGQVDGISISKRIILEQSDQGRHGGAALVAEAHQRRLQVFTWTCRPENAFLDRRFRVGATAVFGRWHDEWAIIRDSGVDGVFVDHPDLGVNFFTSAKGTAKGAP